MTIIVAVDPYMLTLAVPSGKQEDAIDLVTRIAAWGAVAKSGKGCRLALSSRTVDALANADCFPSDLAIERLLADHDLKSVYAIKDIRGQINSILDRSLDLETAAGVHCAIPIHVELTPDPASEVAHPQIADEQRVTVSLVAVGLHLGKFSSASLFVLTRAIDSAVESISASAYIEYQVLGENITRELPFASDVGHVSFPFQIRSRVDPQRLWQTARSIDSIAVALVVGIYRERIKSNAAYTPSKADFGFYVGSEFLDSLRANQACETYKFSVQTFNKSCQTITEAKKVDIKRMWKASAGKRKRTDRVRDADKAVAYRLHVTSGQEALRLMLWKRNDGRYEFANVGVKGEEEILAGDAFHAVGVAPIAETLLDLGS